MDVLICLAVLFYVYVGDKANYYLKYHVLGMRAEIYSNTLYYIMKRGFWSVFLGWATIPLSLLHYLLLGKRKKKDE